MSASLTRYRGLVPAHAGVNPDVVEAWLAAAARAHNAAVFGAVYLDAMVMWAASHIWLGVKLGAIPIEGGMSDPCAVLIPVEVDEKKAPTVESSPYWPLYKSYCRSRAGTGPFVLSPRGYPCP